MHQHGGEQISLVTLTFDLQSGVRLRVTWATSVPILVFLGLSVLDLGTMYATEPSHAAVVFKRLNLS